MSSLLSKQGVRRSFADAAGTYDAHDFLQRDTGDQLIQRLSLMKLRPKWILDAGAGTGRNGRILASRFSGARVIQLDLAGAMLKQGRRQTRRWASPHSFICADIEALPLRAASVDLAFSNLALQWMTDPARACAELKQVLRPDGVILFSTLGPRTLFELKEAFSAISTSKHVNDFTDLHLVGDLLARSGFSDPVIESEEVVVTYRDIYGLLRDLRGIGAVNQQAERRKGLSSRQFFLRLAEAYEPFRTDGLLPATYEVIYAHAWNSSRTPQPEAPGEYKVPVTDIRRRP